MCIFIQKRKGDITYIIGRCWKHPATFILCMRSPGPGPRSPESMDPGSLGGSLAPGLLWCLGSFMEVIDLATFPEAKCGECWKNAICDIRDTVELCPFFEPLEKRHDAELKAWRLRSKNKRRRCYEEKSSKMHWPR